ncbi:HNH endonuclease signature motif containing protein [Streptomyces cinnamoneus]|uniref:HNH endonuclease signature motif containing protein n=1 Tax=Streptomyces cinnamoneus TaxID=53446 RepID=UPI0033F76786
MSSGTLYTRDRLAEAARKCTNINEVIVFFGTQPYNHLPRYLYRRFEHFGIDISHFTRRPYRKYGQRPSPSALHEAVTQSTSIAEALRRLDEPDTTSRRVALRQWISDDGLTTSHFLGQAHQRGKPGTTPKKTSQELLVRHSGSRRTSTFLLRRALSEIGVPEQCASCGTGPAWHGKPMTLEVDHINGDWTDDRPENLRLLCPNCHAVTSTWCRGGSRHRPTS